MKAGQAQQSYTPASAPHVTFIPQRHSQSTASNEASGTTGFSKQRPGSKIYRKTPWRGSNPAQGARDLPASRTSAQHFGPISIPERFGGHAIIQLKEPAEKESAIYSKPTGRAPGRQPVRQQEYVDPQRPSVPQQAYLFPQRPSVPLQIYLDPPRPSAPGQAYLFPQRPSAPGQAYLDPLRPLAPGKAYLDPLRPSVPQQIYLDPPHPVVPGQAYLPPQRPSVPQQAFAAPQQPSASYKPVRRVHPKAVWKRIRLGKMITS